MNTSFIKHLAQFEGKEIRLKGWVMNKRTSKGLIFLLLRDGSGFVQCVINENQFTPEVFESARHTTLESAVDLGGLVLKDEKQFGGYEIQVNHFSLIQLAEEYPIGKKDHGVEFLMDQRHLWLSSKRQWAILKIRNHIIFTIHRFFQEKDFVQLDAPVFTGNAVEGTSTLFETDFYGQPAYLTQSGQLYGEAMAMAMGRIYTFGPTFRAEKSKTRRHLSEFWMIEPEMAFYDLEMDMDLIEEMIRFVVKETLDHCKIELEILDRNTLTLEQVQNPFPRITYTDAVKILRGEKDVNGKNSLTTLENDLKELQNQIEEHKIEIVERETNISAGGMKKGEKNWNLARIGKLKAEIKELEERASNIPQWLESARNFSFGNDFGGSDETVLTRLFSTPIMVYNWPVEIKAFYMKRAEDERFVKGVDVLAPEGFGEIVGGSERENDKDILIQRIKEQNLPLDVFEWYLDLRRYGSVPHSGFGLGLERLVGWICNVRHVRETIPFPRMYGHLHP